VYIDVGVDNSPVTLSMVTSGPTYSRSWKIKITQIRCRDLGKGNLFYCSILTQLYRGFIK
jgi:hypothetical protein